MNKSELLSVAKPILFNTPMVQATLDDRKTATRRIVKFKGAKNPIWIGYVKDGLNLYNGKNEVCNEKPRYKVGDILYVRETWNICDLDIEDNTITFVYKASEMERDEGVRTVNVSDEIYDKYDKSMAENNPDWRPSIHMPKEAARIFLRVTDVRLERLQDMILNDFKREGIIKECAGCPHFHDLCGGMVRLAADCKIDRTINYSAVFAELWDSTVDKKHRGFYGWNGNPWVWVIEFEKLDA